MPNRSIITNIPDTDVRDNRIKTSSILPINFIPKNLFVQFSKVANLYFLIIGIYANDTIDFSVWWVSVILSLSIVVGVSAIKDFYEDMKRKTTDSEINGKTAKIVTITANAPRNKVDGTQEAEETSSGSIKISYLQQM